MISQKLWQPLLLLAFFVLALGSFATPAAAQASRTWVSGVGDDANPCSRTAPCKTFAGAISKTATLGEISCLDPGGFGAVTITKSITIDCHDIEASILNAGTNGINIAFDSFAPSDTKKTVRIRNLNLNGVDTGLIGIRITGGSTGAADSEVFIEDVVIDGDFGGTARGISDERSLGELYVTHTIVRNTGATGIVVAPTGGTRVDAVLDNVRVENTAFGFAGLAGTKAIVSHSVFSGNTTGGINATANAEINVDSSVISGNATGITNAGIIRLSNTDIAFNGTAITGSTQSFGNNRISGNTSTGTAPTLIGTLSNPFGQQ